jgi:hypothetical protein
MSILYRTLARNPLWLREWRAFSRLSRTPWLLGGSTLLLTGVLVLAAIGRGQLESPAAIGQFLFHTCFGLLALFVTLFGPAIAANTVALEREGKTWDALLMAGVKPHAIDRGKFLGAYTHLALYLFALLPCTAIPHLFGGVMHRETLAGVVLVAALGAIAVRIGLLISAALPSTRTALLATVVLSALLCFGLTAAGFEGSRYVEDELHLVTEINRQPVFWPVALVRARLGFDYVRFLVLVPIGFAAIGWFALRELTLFALTPIPRVARPALQRSFIVLAPALALMLGLVPNVFKPATIVETQLVFALSIFGCVLAASGERARSRSSLHSSTILAAGTAIGLTVIPAVTNAVGLMRQARDLPTTPSLALFPWEVAPPQVTAMAVYGSAIMLAIIGVAAFVREAFGRGALTRGVVVATALGILALPAMVAQVLPLFESRTATSIALALSPVLAVGRADYHPELVYGAAFWALGGVGLLLLTRQRERRARV